MIKTMMEATMMRMMRTAITMPAIAPGGHSVPVETDTQQQTKC